MEKCRSPTPASAVDLVAVLILLFALALLVDWGFPFPYAWAVEFSTGRTDVWPLAPGVLFLGGVLKPLRQDCSRKRWGVRSTSSPSREGRYLAFRSQDTGEGNGSGRSHVDCARFGGHPHTWPGLLRPGGQREEIALFQFVERERAEHPVSTMCRVPGVSLPADITPGGKENRRPRPGRIEGSQSSSSRFTEQAAEHAGRPGYARSPP